MMKIYDDDDDDEDDGNGGGDHDDYIEKLTNSMDGKVEKDN